LTILLQESTLTMIMTIISHLSRYSIPLILTVLGGLWITVSRVNLDISENKSSIEHPFTGFQAPEFNLPTIDGEAISLSDLQGSLILVNFWASWCPPCKIEMPTLQRTFINYQNENFILLGINTAYQDDVINVQKSLTEMDITFPILLDNQGIVTKKYQVTALPKTFLISSNGFILDVMIGGPLSETSLKIKIDSALSEK